jgi:diguanylate cyclase (GGDEF)-like protein
VNFVSGPIPIFADEAVRLEVLREYDILDTPPEGSFDNITRLAKLILGTSMSSISLIDKDRQWLKSSQGMDTQVTPRSVSFCAHAITSPDPLIVCDASQDKRFRDNPLVLGEPHIRFYAGMPLVTTANANLGALCVLDPHPRAGGVSAEHLDALYALSRMTVDAIELRRLAVLDSLTDLLTRGAFRHAAKSEFAGAVRDASPLSCVIIDIDHFKAINDTYGHAIGDTVLRSVAAMLRAETRASDLVGRIGGEEFALLLPNTSIEVAIRCAERIRATLATMLVTVAGKRLALTASLGVSTCQQHDEAIEMVMARADRALYASKHAGRNRVSVAADPAQSVSAA